MDIIKDVTPERDLTDQELRQYDIVREEIIRQIDTSGTFDSSDPSQRLFFFSFDGTRNDRDSKDSEYVNSDYRPLEIIAAHEYRDGTFDVVPGQGENVEFARLPGAHAQQVGGYANDILSAGALAKAINHLEQGGTTFKPMDVDDVVNLRLYNAVVQNPYMLRTLITDSRLQSTD